MATPSASCRQGSDEERSAVASSPCRSHCPARGVRQPHCPCRCRAEGAKGASRPRCSCHCRTLGAAGTRGACLLCRPCRHAAKGVRRAQRRRVLAVLLPLSGKGSAPTALSLSLSRRGSEGSKPSAPARRARHPRCPRRHTAERAGGAQRRPCHHRIKRVKGARCPRRSCCRCDARVAGERGACLLYRPCCHTVEGARGSQRCPVLARRSCCPPGVRSIFCRPRTLPRKRS